MGMTWQCHVIRASTIYNIQELNHCLLYLDSISETDDILPGGDTKMLTLFAGSGPASLGAPAKCGSLRRLRASADAFPSFIPKEVERIKDPFARKLATRIERLPVQVKSTGMFGCRENRYFF